MGTFEEAYQKAIKENGCNAGETFARSIFRAGAEWQAKQYPWRNFKEERPKPNSHILRRMSYGKVIYYADFWGENRPDKWEQEDDRVVYEWQYINE